MTEPALADDFVDMLIALDEADAAFVIVGGYAVAVHGHPRATKDIDILVEPTKSNAKKVHRALLAFGAPVDAFNLSEEDLANYQEVLQLGVPPNRIDLLTKADGISFDEAVASGLTIDIEGHAIPVIGLDALLKNKRASGRAQDLADVEALASVLKSRKSVRKTK